MDRILGRLTPTPAGAKGIDWIFPLDRCKKFGGKRIRVSSSLTYKDNTPLVLWVWKGRGTINRRPVKPSSKSFVPLATARSGLQIQSNRDELLELFSFFPGQ